VDNTQSDSIMLLGAVASERLRADVLIFPEIAPVIEINTRQDNVFPATDHRQIDRVRERSRTVNDAILQSKSWCRTLITLYHLKRQHPARFFQHAQRQHTIHSQGAPALLRDKNGLVKLRVGVEILREF